MKLGIRDGMTFQIIIRFFQRWVMYIIKRMQSTMLVMTPAISILLYYRFREIVSIRLLAVSMCLCMLNRFYSVEFSSFSVYYFRLNLISRAMSSHSLPTIFASSRVYRFLNS